jgi:hypothetical protein
MFEAVPNFDRAALDDAPIDRSREAIADRVSPNLATWRETRPEEHEIVVPGAVEDPADWAGLPLRRPPEDEPTMAQDPPPLPTVRRKPLPPRNS